MDESNKVVSRRQAVGLVGMGLATTATGPALAQTGAQAENSRPLLARMTRDRNTRSLLSRNRRSRGRDLPEDEPQAGSW